MLSLAEGFNPGDDEEEAVRDPNVATSQEEIGR
jgi:hypothetical protein